jgi:hypothetical protein
VAGSEPLTAIELFDLIAGRAAFPKAPRNC